MLSVIIAAAGKSTRMGGEDKLSAPLGGQPVLAHSLRLFENSPLCDELILVTDNAALREAAALYAPHKLKACVSGGQTRGESVRRGLAAASGDYICIHDAARPNLTEELLERVYAAARQYGAAIPAVPVSDTVKAENEGFCSATLDRSRLRLAQTPQIFRRDWLESACAAAADEATDDAELLQRAGFPVHIAEGDSANFKLTTPQDMRLMRALYAETRTGCGYDAHRLVEGRELVLGGVTIPFEKGLLGHSDADVLLHAICDALLGAAALGDIGRHFPDSDAQYAGISSLLLLERTAQLLREQGFAVLNVDATVIAQRPKLAPYIDKMRANIAASLGTAAEQISVKATTSEGMGFTGSGEGMAALAACLIRRV